MHTLIKDCRLWDGHKTVYMHGHPIPLRSVGPIVVPADYLVDSDRRIRRAVSDTGLVYLMYWDADGFKHIQIEEVQ